MTSTEAHELMPMGYEAGFAAGERRAFEHRRSGVQIKRTAPMSQYERGFWDGYCPRRADWCVVGRVPFNSNAKDAA